MTKTKIILIVSFLLTFAGGIALGMLISWPEPPAAAPAAPSAEKDRHSLSAELDLTEEQHKQIRAISARIAIKR